MNIEPTGKRNLTANERIFNNDFPWLWAVRPSWENGWVTNLGRIERATEENFCDDFLLKATTESEYSEVWIHYEGAGRVPRFYAVSKVDLSEPTFVRAVRMCFNLAGGIRLLNVAAVRPVSAPRGAWSINQETITIFRAPKGPEALNKLLCLAIRKAGL